MALEITIAGNDITDLLVEGSLRIEQDASSFVSTCFFDLLDKYGTLVLEVKDSLEIVDGPTTYLKGTVANIDPINVGGGETLRQYSVEGQDYNILVEETVIYEEEIFGAERDDIIIDYLFDKYLPEINSHGPGGVPPGYVQHLHIFAELVLSEISLREALDRICQQAEGVALEGYWYIDFDKYLHYFNAESDTPGWYLSDAPDNVNSFPYFIELSAGKRGAGIVNRVLVCGEDASLFSESAASIAYYGRAFEAIVRDNKVSSIEELQDRGNAILAKSAYAEVTYTVTTRKAGLRAGMDVRFVNALLGVDDTFTVRTLTLTFPEHVPTYALTLGGKVSKTSLIAARLSLDEKRQAAAPIPAGQLPLSSRGWKHTLIFTATDPDTVAWSSGTIVTANGRVFNIQAGNTGNMAVVTYIYFDQDDSETQLQISALGPAAGERQILIAVAKPAPGTEDAAFFVFGGNYTDGTGVFITADNIAAGTITANEIAANTIVAGNIAVGTITADRMNVAQLSAISADMGSITAGTVTGATIRTAAAGARVELTSAAGICSYNAGAVKTLQLAVDGSGQLGASGKNPLVLAADGQLDKIRANQLTLGEGLGYVVTQALLHCPYDGPRPYEADFQVDLTGHLGQKATISGGVIGRPGKFGKGAQVAVATTNNVYNPIFENNVTDSWLFWQGGAGGSRNRDTTLQYVGSASCRVDAGTGECHLYAPIGGTFLSLANGESVTGQVRIFIQSGAPLTSAKVMLYDRTNNTARATWTSSSTGGWQYITLSWTNNTGGTVNVDWVLINRANDSSSKVWFDGVQFEKLAYTTPLCHGSMGAGHSWSGTAHNSTSSRTIASLTYANPLSRLAGTVSLWWRPAGDYADAAILRVLFEDRDAPAVGMMGYYAAADDKFYLFDGTTYLGTGVQTFAADVPVHLVFTWSTTTSLMKIYVNGTEAASGVYTAPAATPTLFVGTGLDLLPANGVLDDLLALEYALTADNVLSLYQSQAPATVITNGWEFMMTGPGRGKVWGHAGGIFGQAADGTASWALANEDGISWGGFTMNIGDVVLGHNRASSAAIFWDKSTGKFGFYGNASATVQVEIGTDGSLLAGAGAVQLNALGITLTQGATSANWVKWDYSGTPVAMIYAYYADDVLQEGVFAVDGISASTPPRLTLGAAGAGALANATIYLLGQSTGNAASASCYLDTLRVFLFNGDAIFTLGDQDGVKSLQVLDSASNKRASIDSDGNLNAYKISTGPGPLWELGSYIGGVPTADGYVLITIGGAQVRLLADLA